MRTILAVAAACLCLWPAHDSPASGRSRSTVQVFTQLQPGTVIQSGAQVFVVTPFSVPVGIPIAPLAVTVYQAVPSGMVQPQAANAQQPTASAQRTETLVQKNCKGCHSGESPKAGLDLTGELSDATRLKAISRVLADDATKRMPKGKTLDATTLGLLIQELAKKPPAKAEVDEPPVLEPEGE